MKLLTGIYAKQLSVIAICVVLITIGVLSSAFKSDEPKVVFEKQNTHVCSDPDHTSCDGLCECDGFECDASERNDALDEIINTWQEENNYHPLKLENGYSLLIQDENTFILKDGRKTIHVFNRNFAPNRNLFYVVDRDNR